MDGAQWRHSKARHPRGQQRPDQEVHRIGLKQREGLSWLRERPAVTGKQKRIGDVSAEHGP